MKNALHLCILLLCAVNCDSARPSDTPSAKSGELVQTPETGRLSSGLPGAEPVTATLMGEMVAARKRILADPKFKSRTRHTKADGTPEYTNRLVLEASPYLQQHAFNPVDWHPWGDEAFEMAARLNRPVLLSIGYSTCHWCHVMEHESFEDVEIAEFLNANYIAIKVDREERPDIDEVYMRAVRMLTGSGGWPMTVWVTPERTPFMGGTYFPPRAGARGSRRGFLDLLKELSEEYKTDPAGVSLKAQELSSRLVKSLESTLVADVQDPKGSMRRAVSQYASSYDLEFGGWGTRNKFPMPSRLRFLLRYQRRAIGPNRAKEIAVGTLNAMMAGGVYDHVGGGFHRYSVDRGWTVPHFEKMLYDNAQLILAYTDAWLVTKDPRYKRVVAETITYLLRDMRATNGAFWAASDAQEEGKEGLYYTWTEDEAGKVLTREELEFTKAHWGLGANNFKGRTILRIPRDDPHEPKFFELETKIMAKLRAVRTKREAPGIDDKLIAGWNGIALEALSKAAFVFKNPVWVAAARKLGDTLLGEFRNAQGQLARSITRGKRGPNAVSEDYVFIISGLLELFQTTGVRRWVDAAIALQSVLDKEFWDNESGGYFRTPHRSSGELIARERPSYDGAIPSANSYAAYTLVRLHRLTLDPAHRDRAKALFKAFGRALNNGGAGMPMMLSALDFETDLSKEVAIIGDSTGSEPLLQVLRTGYYPNMVFLQAQESDVESLSKVIKWVAEKKARSQIPTAYVCRDSACKLPTSDPEEFKQQLQEMSPL